MWTAGCASGQEAYTCAMVLAELIGIEAYRDRVKIYATDIDEEALSQARLAVFDAKEMESVPPDLREKDFERTDQRQSFRKDLRRTVIFGRNNLVQDAPISRLDVLICRNTLMYFNAETQARILRHFHFALRDTGVLMLGKSPRACAPLGGARRTDRAGAARAARVPVGESEFSPDRGDHCRLDVSVTPLLSAENVAIGVSVTVEDVTRYAAMQSELEATAATWSWPTRSCSRRSTSWRRHRPPVRSAGGAAARRAQRRQPA